MLMYATSGDDIFGAKPQYQVSALSDIRSHLPKN